MGYDHILKNVDLLEKLKIFMFKPYKGIYIKYLIIAEKPKVAEKIAQALAQGKFERARLNDITYYRVNRDGNEITIAPAVGHVYSLKESDRGSFPVFNVRWIPAYDVDKGAAYTKNYVKTIEQLAKSAEVFVCACDYDLEGSLIGRNVIRFACKSEKGKRMKFSSLTADELVEAFEGMVDLDYLNAEAGEARHILDYYYGINLSRALMNAIKKAGSFKIMSIGRVQGPALEILAKREKDILGFKPEPYWQIFAYCKDVRFSHEKDRFRTREDMEKALEASDKNAKVNSVDSRRFKVMPNVPFDLTSMQIEAYRCFGFSPTQTLELAQSLYEGSHISYPRTSSQKLPVKLNLQKIIKDIGTNEQYRELAGKLISANRFKPFEGSKEDPAHPAIHPTGIKPEKLNEKELKLYDLVVKRFLSCFAEQATKESSKVVLLAGTEKYDASGMRIVEKGWMEIYAPYAKMEEDLLPEFKKGEGVVIERFENVQKMTQPPKRYTPASIIQTLEDLELGTKATRAGIIDTLYKRGYLEDQNIKVTSFGLAVCTALEKNCPLILDEQLTREIETKMNGIQEGKIKEDKVIEEGKRMLTKILDDLVPKERDIGRELLFALKEMEMQDNIMGKCNLCGSNLRRMFSKLGKQFVGCSGYPTCKNIFPLPQGALVSPVGKICPSCSTPIIKVRRKGKKMFEMCLLPTCETKKNWGQRSSVVSKPKPPS